jgi:hypothetical protein
VRPDFRDLSRAFCDAEVRFLIVGAYAVTAHAEPRATGGLDIWVEPTTASAARAYRALRAFGAPLHELSEPDLAQPGVVFQIGLPPRRIDILTSITGVEFQAVWPDRRDVHDGDVAGAVSGRNALIENERRLGRARDLADLDLLERHSSQGLPQ